MCLAEKTQQQHQKSNTSTYLPLFRQLHSDSFQVGPVMPRVLLVAVQSSTIESWLPVVEGRVIVCVCADPTMMLVVRCWCGTWKCVKQCVACES